MTDKQEIDSASKVWIQHRPGSYSSAFDFILTRCPTIEELEIFLCDMVPKVRIVHFYVVRGESVEAPEWHQKFLAIVTDLALRYRPWQFSWGSQEYGAVTVGWVEVEDWYYKYNLKEKN